MSAFISNGETQYFAVAPILDLFVLRPFDYTPSHWTEVIGDVPFFPGMFTGNDYTLNVAVEWDPAWVHSEDEGWRDWYSTEADYHYDDYKRLREFRIAHTGLGSVMRLCGDEYPPLPNVWIIDPRIRRTSSQVPLPPDRIYWTLGDGRKIVEVRGEDEGWTRFLELGESLSQINAVLDQEYNEHKDVLAR